MSIGSRIKALRKARGLTQKELASLANISRSYLSDVECDRYNPSIDMLRMIAGALHVDLSLLVADQEVSSELSPDMDIRRIERARRRMSPQRRQDMMTILETAFAEFFTEDS